MRFGPPLQSNPLADLLSLEQTGSIEEYQRQFQNLLAHASIVRMDQQVRFAHSRPISEYRIGCRNAKSTKPNQY